MSSFKFKRRSGPCLSRRWSWLQACLLCLLGLSTAVASDGEEPGTGDLPTVRHLAAALAEPVTRDDALLTMITVARLLDYGSPASEEQADGMLNRFREERAWLARLADRYLGLPMRGSIMDPAAWIILLELDQHRMDPDTRISPLGPPNAALARQIFERGDERVSAVLLPQLMQRIEPQALPLWQSLLERAERDAALLTVMDELRGDWFDPWVAAEPPAPGRRAEAHSVMDWAIDQLRAQGSSLIMAGPPDALGLKRLRFSLISELPTLDGIAAREARYALVLSTAMDGVHEGRYLALAETLLWIVTDQLLSRPLAPRPPVAPGSDATIGPSDLTGPVAPGPDAADEEAESPPTGMEEAGPAPALPYLLSDLLPPLSSALSGEIAQVDPRINAALATVFDVVQFLQADNEDQERGLALRRAIADAVAQLVLLLPDMDYYLDQPVRRPIAEEIDICTSIAVHTGGRGLPALTREQFDGCLRSMVDLAADQASREELAGDPDGPFGPEQLRREMMMPPWQRVNFALGYLHEQYPSSCSPPQAPVSNPLEWSGLATMLAWFARQEPVFLQTPENEALILEMRRQGTQLLQDVLQQVDCVAGAGTGVNDPIVRSLADYQRALDAMVAGLRQAELEFRASRLSPGADVVLHGNADQRTAYRSEDMTIGPCDRAEVCEMGSELEATRALIGLFPNPYLVADQTRLGTIEICYTNMRWVERRSEPVRPDDPYVANYFGRLSFDLIGRYRHGDEARTVFGANFVSPEEYHYLFAAATEEVLADDCPTEWVGSRIVTGLGKTSGIRVVPDRLTYLAAARTRPSEVIAANWSRGAQWRDWFVTGLGVEPLSIEADEGISDRIDRHLQSLYQAEQSTLYNALLRPPTRAGGSKLNELQEDLTARKALVRAYMQLFYPRHMIDSDDIRGSLEGRGSLLDLNMLRRFREEGVAVSSINAAGIARMERLETVWNRQPEVERRSGSVAVSVAHAVTRLNDLHHEFFVSPRSAPEPGYGDLRPGAPNR